MQNEVHPHRLWREPLLYLIAVTDLRFWRRQKQHWPNQKGRQNEANSQVHKFIIHLPLHLLGLALRLLLHPQLLQDFSFAHEIGVYF